jgi:hypothetical protein
LFENFVDSRIFIAASCAPGHYAHNK